MAEISASEVKRLREKTAAGMMDCKNALVETGGDFEKAVKLLKEKGLAALGQRTGRATNEGKVFVKTKPDGSSSVVVELACETDFVAKNPDFIVVGNAIAEKALAEGTTEPTDDLNNMITDLATKIRENMGIKRLKLVNAQAGEHLTQYIHGDGKIGVIVKCKSDNPEIFKSEEVKEFIFTLALHTAAFNPLALDRSKVQESYIKEQEEIFRALMDKDEKLKGKPENQLDGILKGKINKHLAEICFLEQAYIRDDKITVQKAIEDCGKKAGASLSLTDYIYLKVGEGES